MAVTWPLANQWTDGVTVTAVDLQTKVTDPLNELYALSQGAGGKLLGEAAASSGPTFANANQDYPTTPNVTFTLSVQRRVRLELVTRITTGAATGRYTGQPAYNTGSTVVIGSATKIGIACFINNQAAVAAILTLVAAFTVVLPAGTYTSYGAVARNTGGTTGDSANQSYVAAYDLGTA